MNAYPSVVLSLAAEYSRWLVKAFVFFVWILLANPTTSGDVSAKEDPFGKGNATFPPGPENRFITFDDGLVIQGDKVENQYASQGITFRSGHSSPGVVNPSATAQPFGTVDANVIAEMGGDVGSGLAFPIAGKLLHSFSSWLTQNGDPSITMDFSSPIDRLSLDVGGIGTPASNVLYAIDGNDAVIGSMSATTAGVVTLSLSGLGNFQRAVLTMGDFNDWVGVDNISFNVVPEPCGGIWMCLWALCVCRPCSKMRARTKS